MTFKVILDKHDTTHGLYAVEGSPDASSIRTTFLELERISSFDTIDKILLNLDSVLASQRKHMYAYTYDNTNPLFSLSRVTLRLASEIVGYSIFDTKDCRNVVRYHDVVYVDFFWGMSDIKITMPWEEFIEQSFCSHDDYAYEEEFSLDNKSTLFDFSSIWWNRFNVRKEYKRMLHHLGGDSVSNVSFKKFNYAHTTVCMMDDNIYVRPHFRWMSFLESVSCDTYLVISYYDSNIIYKDGIEVGQVRFQHGVANVIMGEIFDIEVSRFPSMPTVFLNCFGVFVFVMCEDFSPHVARYERLEQSRTLKRRHPGATKKIEEKSHRRQKRVDHISIEEMAKYLSTCVVFDNAVDEQEHHTCLDNLTKKIKIKKEQSGPSESLEAQFLKGAGEVLSGIGLSNEVTDFLIDLCTTVGGLITSTNVPNTLFILTGFAARLLRDQKHVVTDMLQMVSDTLSSKPKIKEEQSYVANARQIMSSPVFAHMGVIASALVTIGLISPKNYSLGGYKLFHMQAMKNTTDCTTLLDTVLETMDYFITTGWKCFEKGSLSPFSNISDELTRLSDVCIKLENHLDLYLNGNYEIHTGHKQSQFVYDVEQLGKDIELAQSLHQDKTAKIALSYLNAKYTKIHTAEVTFQMKSTFREEPFSISLFGQSSVGKSNVCSLLNNTILRFNKLLPEGKDGLENPSKYTVNVNTESSFDDNFRSDVLTYILDDFANVKHTKALKNPTGLLIRMINNTPSTATSADLKDKGKISLLPKLVMVTTNVQNLDVAPYTNNVQSVLRRLHLHVTVRVKKEFSDENGMISRETPMPPPGEISDIWEFTVNTPLFINDNLSNGVLEKFEVSKNDFSGDSTTGLDKMPTLENISIFQLMEYVEYKSSRHYKKQKNIVLNNTEGQSNDHFCSKCNRHKQLCKCKIVIKGEQSFMFDTATSWMAKEIYKHAVPMARTWMSFFVPDWSDVYMYKFLRTTELIKIRYKMSSSLYGTGMFDYIPSCVVASPYFKHYFYWATRNQVKSRICLGIAAPAIVGAALSCYTRRVDFFVTGLIASPIIASSVVHHVVNEMDTELERQQDSAREILKYHKEQSASCGKYKRSFSIVSHIGMTTLVVAGVVTGVSVLRKVWNLVKNEDVVEHSALSPTDDEILSRDKKVNIWRTVDHVNTKDPVTFDWKAVEHRVSKNLWSVTYVAPGRNNSMCNGLMYSTNYMLLPYHIWFDLGKGEDICGTPTKYVDITVVRAKTATTEGLVVNGSISHKRIYSSNMMRVGGADLCVVKIYSGGDVKSLARFFPTKEESGRNYTTQSRCVFRSGEGEIITMDAVSNSIIAEYTRGDNFISWPATETTRVTPWKPGDCGTVMISKDSSPRICGLHVLGTDTCVCGVGSSPTRDDIDLSILKIENSHYGSIKMEESGEIPEILLGVPVVINQKLPADAPMLYDNNIEGNISVVGAMGNQVTYRTEIKPSILVPHLEEHYGPSRWRGPRFGTWHNWAAYLTNASRPVQCIDPDLLDRATLDYVVDIMKNMATLPHLVSGSTILTNSEILIGRDGVRFIDSMKMNSSCGFPLTGKKRNIINIIEEDGKRNADFIDPNIWLEITKCEEMYIQGISQPHFFKGCLKDEVLLDTKEGARVFQAAPLVLQCLVRKYYLPIVRILSLIPLVSECAVGINAYSLEYDELHNHIVKYGDNRIIAGDYSKWDQRLPEEVTSRAFGILIKIAERTGNYTEVDLKVMRGIADSIVRPYVMMNGVAYQFWGSNPSGQNLTAYINSMVNSLFLRMGFFRKHPQLSNFRQYVSPMTYGDDVIAGISSQVDFTMRDYKLYMDEIGMKFTLPDKSEITSDVRFMNMKQASFLKRTSHKIPELGVWIGKLDIDSILKSLYCYNKSTKESQNNVMADCLRSAANEFFFHGREIYDAEIAKLRDVSTKAQLIVGELDRSFDDRIELWNETYRPLLSEK